jgi:hypothetical protein
MPRLRKRHAAVSTVLVALTFTGHAFGQWAGGAPGTGGGSVTVRQTTVLAGMYPGDRPQVLAGVFDNPGQSPVHVRTVTVRVAGVHLAPGAPAGRCDATDFALTGETMQVGADVPAGAGQAGWSGATIQLADKPTNQDACQGAAVELAYTAR